MNEIINKIEEAKSKLLAEKDVLDFAFGRLKILCTQQGYKDQFSKKAIAWQISKKFMYTLSDDTIIFFAPYYTHDQINVNIERILPIRTKTGILYYNLNKIDPYQVYSSHLLDRYDMRLGLGLPRSKTLRMFIEEEIKGSLTLTIRYTDNNISSAVNSGLLLGDMIDDQLIVWKTFVNKSMLGNDQKQIVEKTLAMEFKITKIESAIENGIELTEDELKEYNYWKGNQTKGVKIQTTPDEEDLRKKKLRSKTPGFKLYN